MSERSVASDAVTQDLLYAATSLATAEKGAPERLLAQLIRILRDHFRNGLRGCCLVAAPTTASTQATGASGVTEVRVNLPAFQIVVNGVSKDFAAAADTVLHDTTVYTGYDSSTLTSGKSAIITIAAENAAGTVALKYAKGGTATTGSQVAPTDAVITAACTASAAWVKICEVTINRTGDTAITQAQDNAKTPLLALTQDSVFFNGFSD